MATSNAVWPHGRKLVGNNPHGGQQRGHSAGLSRSQGQAQGLLQRHHIIIDWADRLKDPAELLYAPKHHSKWSSLSNATRRFVLPLPLTCCCTTARAHGGPSDACFNVHSASSWH